MSEKNIDRSNNDINECPSCGAKVSSDDILCSECDAILFTIYDEGLNQEEMVKAGNNTRKNIRVTNAGIKCLSCGHIFTATYLEGDDPYFTCPRCGMHRAEAPEA